MIDLDWKTILLGIDNEYTINCIISLICYIIYKKYIREKDQDIHCHTDIYTYVRNEIHYRLSTYSENICNIQCRILLHDIIEYL